MRVLISGHLGYIGPVMIRCFKEAGHQVTGLDTGYFKESSPTLPDEFLPDREVLKDVRELSVRDFEGQDCVVHLAALSNDPMGELTPQLTFDINYESSVAAARFAKEAGVRRFIFASSCSLYGAAAGDGALTEESPFNPVSAYAVSKVKTEQSIGPLADRNFAPVFMRNATAFGVSPRMRFDLVLNNLMAWAKTTGRIRVTSDGTPWRPLVHISDISLAALSAAQAPVDLVRGQAFNVGRSDANYRIREVAEAVSRQVPDAALEITGETGGDLRSYRVDFSKIAALPGFIPAWTIERGCVELDEYFSRHAMTAEEFQSWKYIRLKQLRRLMDSGRLSSHLRWQ